MDNLWNKDRKKLFRELYHQYLEEGYENKEAKRLAKEEAEDMDEAIDLIQEEDYEPVHKESIMKMIDEVKEISYV